MEIESVLNFSKMHGAGNDFIVIDDRDGCVPWQRSALMAAMAARHTGVDCEGIILIQADVEADFRMRFLNPDGREAGMCGNGARCAAWYAFREGIAPPRMSIQTSAGVLGAAVDGNVVRVEMTPPRNRRYDLALNVGGAVVMAHAIDSGVPHAVVWVDDVASYDVAGVGRSIRYDAAFAPAGTNADFVAIGGAGETLRIRTYERGVEAETLACGTGMVAAAVVAVEQGRAQFPVSIRCASGDLLTVTGTREEGVCVSATLTGPACEVFRGSLDLALFGQA